MLRFIDGFDYYSIAQLFRKWTGNYAGTTANYFIVAGRSGASALQQNSSNRGIFKTFDNQATWTIGFAFQQASVQASVNEFLVGMFDGSISTSVGNAQVWIRLNAGGTLSVCRGNNNVLGTTTLALQPNVWYYIEFQFTVNSSTGSYILKVNGQTVSSGTGLNTQATGNPYAATFGFGSFLNNGYQISVTMDDLYICDSTGINNTGFLGDVKVETVMANAVGSNTNFVRFGAGNNYQCINDSNADDDATFVEASGVNVMDTYKFASLSGTPDTIFGVQANLVSRKTDAGFRSGCIVTWISSTEYDGSGISFFDSYLNNTQIWETSPNGTGVWTASTFNNAEFGVKILG